MGIVTTQTMGDIHYFRAGFNVGIRWTGPEEALNYDTMAISVAAVMFLGLVPTARSYRLVVFLVYPGFGHALGALGVGKLPLHLGL